MAAASRFMPLDRLRIGDLLQRPARMADLSAAPLARFPTRAAGNARRLLQSVAGGRLAAVRAVLAQLTTKARDLIPQAGVLASQGCNLFPKRRVLSPKHLHLAAKRVDQLLNLGRTTHPHLDSHFAPCRPDQSQPTKHFHQNCCNSDSPWELRGNELIWRFSTKSMPSYKRARGRRSAEIV